MATPTAAKADAAEAPAKKKGKGKLLLLVAVVVLVAAGAAYWFLFKGSAEADAAPAEPKVELGSVVTVDPISVNLADGHYLKIGVALQETKAVKEDVDGSRALDAVIELYSGKQMSELSDPAGRDALKKELVETVEKDYDDEVVDVYFTEYVMQ